MRFRVGRFLPTAVVTAAMVAVSAASSPAVAQVPVPVGPTVVVHSHTREKSVERRAERFRGRYQLRLSQARKL